LIVLIAGRVGLNALSRVLVAGAVGLVIWELARRIAAAVGLGAMPSLRAFGMAGNPNAFAFQLLMAFAALISGVDFRRRGAVTPSIFAGVILAGLWLAGSRAAIGALLAVTLLVPLVSSIDLRLYAGRLAFAGIIAGFVLLAPDLACNAGNLHAGIATDSADI